MTPAMTLDAPAELRARIEERLDRLARDRVVERIWARDHTVWRNDPREIADRLGWLDAPQTMPARLDEIRAFAGRAADDGFTHAVLLGMGGSSLAAETIRAVEGVASGALHLAVLDSTHPGAVRRVERGHDPGRTLYVAASKSGATIETLCHLQYFYARIRRGDRFATITDPGSPLGALAGSHGFRAVFENPPDVGGRYSALTLFGLVPAALCGADPGALLDAAAAAAERCREPAGGNPGALLGVALAEAALAGRDAAAFVFPEALAGLGAWVEQLVAESTGKDGRGILPVPADAPEAGRFAVAVGDAPVDGPHLRIPAEPLGGLLFLFEFATAVAGHVLDVHPFDQPNVAEAKDATAAILDQGGAPAARFDDPAAVLDAEPPRYAGLLAYVDPGGEHVAALEAARRAIRDRLGVAVTAGIGPRYLHSTGQLHKGGPPGGSFLLVAEAGYRDDPPIPGRGFTFGALLDAQAAGDLRSLGARGRRVTRIRPDDLASLAGGSSA